MTDEDTENWLEQDRSDSGYHTWSETWTAEETMAAETKDNEHKEEMTEKKHGLISTRSFHTVTPVMTQTLSNIIPIFVHGQNLW